MSAIARSALILVILTAIPAAIFAWSYRTQSPSLESVDPSSIPPSGGINDAQPMKIQELLAAENNHLNLPRQSHSFYKLLNTHRCIEFNFINSPGLGVGRTPSITYWATLVELPDPEPLLRPLGDHHLPPTNNSSETSSAVVDEENWQLEWQTWQLEKLVNVMHFPTREYVEWEETAKYAELTRAVSLRPHAFDAQLVPRENSEIRHRIWQFDDASLVSLLKHRQGAVYISSFLPTMDDLYMNFPTRPLDEFETFAISQLRTSGEELVVTANANHLRMVGSIRAAHQCLECHQVPQGTLLGAFTYRLRRFTLTIPGKDDSASSVPIRALD